MIMNWTNHGKIAWASATVIAAIQPSGTQVLRGQAVGQPAPLGTLLEASVA